MIEIKVKVAKKRIFAVFIKLTTKKSEFLLGTGNEEVK